LNFFDPQSVLSGMKWPILLAVPLLFAAGGGPKSNDLQLVDKFNDAIQARFADPAPAMLGISRMTTPASMGHSFTPLTTNVRDLDPGATALIDAANALEAAGLQTGFYVFGEAVTESPAEAMSFRALKGPAVATVGTPRPCWYPPLDTACKNLTNALPDWKEIYPLAQRAMRSFADGGKGFETPHGVWNIAVRPVLASAPHCVMCHVTNSIRVNRPLGGVIYAFRREPSAD
jgi:hypothetical protein